MEQHYILLDIETTGIDPLTSEIIEVALIEYENGEVVDELCTLVKPRRPIPRASTKIHKIKTKDCADAPPMEDIIDEIVAWLESDIPIITFNGTRFDLPMLQRDAIALRDTRVDVKTHIDVFKLCKRAIPGLDSYSLRAVSDHFNTPSPIHRAKADLISLRHVYMAVSNMTGNELSTYINEEKSTTIQRALIQLSAHAGKIERWVHLASTMPCETEDHYKTTVEAVISLKSLKKELEADRQEHTRPMKTVTKKIESHWRHFALTPISEALAAIVELQQPYLMEQHRLELQKQREAEEAAKETADAVAELAHKSGKTLDEANDIADDVFDKLAHENEEPKRTKTRFGTSGTKVNYEVEIIDPKAVPTTLWSPDIKKIQLAIEVSDGQISIPGVTFKPVFTTRTRAAR